MKWSLRSHIIVIFIVSVLLVTGVSAIVGVEQASTRIRDAVVAEQRGAASSAGNGIWAVIQEDERTLTATSASIQQGDLEPSVDQKAIAALFDPLVAYSQDYSTVLLVGDDGKVIFSRPPDGPLSSGTFAAGTAFRTTRADQESALSLDPAAGPPHWVVSVPASRATASTYYLVGVLKTGKFNEILFANLPSGGDALAVHENGAIMASTLTNARIESLADWNAWQSLASDQDHVVEATHPGTGIGVLVTRMRTEALPMSVVVMTPKSEIVALQNQLASNAVLTSVSLAATAVVLGVVATGFVTKPLAEVRAAARRMSGGDLEARARPRGARELADLATDFNAMAAALAQERAELLEFQRKLETLVAERTAELERKRQEMELFFYTVSHDIKSPVITINGFTQLADEAIAKTPPAQADATEYLSRARRAGESLERLVYELMEFARAERLAPTYKAVLPNEIVGNVFSELRPFAEDCDVRLSASGPTVRVETDPTRLRHITRNLVHNAIKYMPPKSDGEVAVEWSLNDGEFTLRVRDNGAGIPMRIQADLFRPFSYGRKPGSHGGSGLGLSIVKRLVESLQGSIVVESSDGQGATFTVSMPARHGESSEAA